MKELEDAELKDLLAKNLREGKKKKKKAAKEEEEKKDEDEAKE